MLSRDNPGQHLTTSQVSFALTWRSSVGLPLPPYMVRHVAQATGRTPRAVRAHARWAGRRLPAQVARVHKRP